MRLTSAELQKSLNRVFVDAHELGILEMSSCASSFQIRGELGSLLMRGSPHDVYCRLIKNSDFNLLLVDKTAWHFSWDFSGNSVKLRYCCYPEILTGNLHDVSFGGQLAVRYDYDENAYRPGEHGASHFQFHFSNVARINSGVILTPRAFFLLIVYLSGSPKLEDGTQKDLLKRLKGEHIECPIVPVHYWQSGVDTSHPRILVEGR